MGAIAPIAVMFSQQLAFVEDDPGRLSELEYHSSQLLCYSPTPKDTKSCALLCNSMIMKLLQWTTDKGRTRLRNTANDMSIISTLSTLWRGNVMKKLHLDNDFRMNKPLSINDKHVNQDSDSYHEVPDCSRPLHEFFSEARSVWTSGVWPAVCHRLSFSSHSGAFCLLYYGIC